MVKDPTIAALVTLSNSFERSLADISNNVASCEKLA